MNLFLDCEFNSFGGELISIALVPEKEFSPQFYQAVQITQEIHPWVAENVMPILGIPQKPKEEVQKSLLQYLSRFEAVHIVADWPEDIAYFCNLCITGPGQRILLPKITFELAFIPSLSAVPHNALHDAIGIREAYLKK